MDFFAMSIDQKNRFKKIILVLDPFIMHRNEHIFVAHVLEPPENTYFQFW